jgi:8-oxo-dGTP pyrophosphatase MutT (NUDIX family)
LPITNPNNGDDVRLTGADAVAAIIRLDDGRYLLQHRDDMPHIWYPGYWGCFGGAVEEGEDPKKALWRELYEEIEFKPVKVAYFSRFDFDLGELGLSRFYRIYYVVPMSKAEYDCIVLHEGQAVDAFPGEVILNAMRLTPYDAFALFLYHARNRIGTGSIKKTPW